MSQSDDIKCTWVVPKNGGTPKWMVCNGKPKNKMDDLGGKNSIFGNTHISSALFYNFWIHSASSSKSSFVCFFLGVLPPRSCSFLSEFGILTASLSVKPETAPAGRNHNGSSGGGGGRKGDNLVTVLW